MVACYIRKNLCFNKRALHCKEIENIIFDIILPKPRPNFAKALYVFSTDLQAKVTSWSLIVKDFSYLNLKDNRSYFNLLQNENHILNEKRVAPSQEPVHTLINK